MSGLFLSEGWSTTNRHALSSEQRSQANAESHASKEGGPRYSLSIRLLSIIRDSLLQMQLVFRWQNFTLSRTVFHVSDIDLIASETTQMECLKPVVGKFIRQ
ncbi:unnamed protein product [Pipistrellus nathusii]|uniref:Uncharacterized protein n=1 Tax=Pipistrellus nathusii TaxID=59473 RepID=A0ABN9Z7N5_PIPNA